MTHRWIKSGYRTLFWLAVLLVANGPAAAVLAQPPALTISVTPGAVTLPPGQTATITIVAGNPTAAAAEALSLSWFTNTPLHVELLTAPDVAGLPPGADVAWTARLQSPPHSPAAGVVHWRLDYAWPQEEGTAVSRVLLSQVTVSAPALTAVEQVAGVTVATTLTTLNEQRPGVVSLILENKQDAPLQIEAIRPLAPDDVTLTVPDGLVGGEIAPRRQIVIPVAVSAEKIVQPGKKLLLFEIDLTWRENGAPQQSTLVAVQEVDVGVFGESQILTLLGVPAFFLLPGFLLLTAFKFAWRWGKSAEEVQKWPLPGTGADFWAVAITLSLLAAVVYPLATQWLDVRRDYLQVYGLQDVFNIWFGSVLVGIGAHSVYRGGAFLWRLRRRRVAQQRTPAAGDSPQKTIERLALRDQLLARETAVVTLPDKAHRVFYLQDGPGHAGPAWVAPLIYITNREALPPALVTELETAVFEADAAGSLQKIIAHLPRLTMIYHPDWPFEGPYQAAENEITHRGGERQSIVTFQ